MTQIKLNAAARIAEVKATNITAVKGNKDIGPKGQILFTKGTSVPAQVIVWGANGSGIKFQDSEGVYRFIGATRLENLGKGKLKPEEIDVATLPVPPKKVVPWDVLTPAAMKGWKVYNAYLMQNS